MTVLFTLLGGTLIFDKTSLIRRAESKTGIAVTGADGEQLLVTLTSQLTVVHSDLSQFPITYYFHSGDERNALSTALPYLFHLTERLGDTEIPSATRLHATALREAIEDFSTTLGMPFTDLPTSPPEKVLEAYARAITPRPARRKPTLDI